MTTTETFERHPKTGLPIEPVPTFEVGDLVSEGILSDAYPGVVVAATPKRVWVRGVRYFLGNVQENDVPGYNGYGDSATLTIDPESVDEAIARGKEGASKYVLHVYAKPTGSGSIAERERFGGDFHRARWRKPGGYGSLSKGARFRQDPHV